MQLNRSLALFIWSRNCYLWREWRNNRGITTTPWRPLLLTPDFHLRQGSYKPRKPYTRSKASTGRSKALRTKATSVWSRLKSRQSSKDSNSIMCSLRWSRSNVSRMGNSTSDSHSWTLESSTTGSYSAPMPLSSRKLNNSSNS